MGWTSFVIPTLFLEIRAKGPTADQIRIRKLVEKNKLNNRRTVIIQVGANDGSATSHADPVRDVLGYSNVHAELIEPNPPVFAMLQANLMRRFGNISRIHTSNVAVCRSSRTVSIFTMSREFARDYPNAPHWAKFELSSLNRDHLIKHYYKMTATNLEIAKKGNKNTTSLRTQKVKNLPLLAMSMDQFRNYITEVRVPCRSPRDILDDVKLEPRDVDVLVIDAEGFDDQVVMSFLDVDGCKPSILTWEMKHLSPAARTLILSFISQRNYSHSCSNGTCLNAWAWTQ